MNNEPVAWMWRMKNSDNRWELAFNKPMTEQFFDTEPLYIHPAKTLTDKEILELTKDSTIFEYREFDDDMVRFARAILRKAQEK
jgi:hypothetical protein